MKEDELLPFLFCSVMSEHGIQWHFTYTWWRSSQGGEEKKPSRKGEKATVDKAARRREKEQEREAAAAEAAEQRRKQAELELLLMDESAPRQANPSGRLPSFRVFVMQSITYVRHLEAPMPHGLALPLIERKHAVSPSTCHIIAGQVWQPPSVAERRSGLCRGG